MGDSIQVSDDALQAVASLLGQGVDDYCSFGLLSLYGAAPVAGSAEHDGPLQALMRDALGTFAGVMRANSSVVQGMGQAFAAADAAAAQAFSKG